MTSSPFSAIGSSAWPGVLPDEGALAAHWGRDCLYTPSAPQGFLFGLRDVRDVLCDARTTPGYVAISTADYRNVDASEYTVDPKAGENLPGHPKDRLDLARIAEFLAGGSSLMLLDVQAYHSGVREICRSLQDRTGRPVKAIVFLSPPGRGALPLHQDRVDVVVIQTHGTKNWQIFEHFPGQDTFGPVMKPAGASPAHRITLTPGDSCYIPAGRPHQTRSADDWSVHISLTISPIRPTQVLEECFQRVLPNISDVDVYPGWDGSISDRAAMERAAEMMSRSMASAFDCWKAPLSDEYRLHDQVAAILEVPGTEE